MKKAAGPYAVLQVLFKKKQKKKKPLYLPVKVNKLTQ